MKQNEDKRISLPPATLERNVNDALTLCERTSERCLRISAKVRAAKKVEEKV